MEESYYSLNLFAVLLPLIMCHKLLIRICGHSYKVQYVVENYSHASVYLLAEERRQFPFQLKKTISCSFERSLSLCIFVQWNDFLLAEQLLGYIRSFLAFVALFCCFMCVVYIVLLGLLRKPLVQNNVRSKTKSVRKPFIFYDFLYISLACLITQELVTLATSCVWPKQVKISGHWKATRTTSCNERPHS